MDHELFDPEVLKLLREEGESLFAALVDLFESEVPLQLSRLREALASTDLATVARIAHTLKGTAANFGARRMQELAGRVFNTAEQGAAADIPAMLEPLRQECALVETALQELRRSP